MDGFHPSILVLLGIGVLGGAMGAWFFQKIRIPQVVGYIVFGIIVGQSGLKLIDAAQIESFKSFTWFALGIIGFLVGGELRADTFRKYGKQFISILLWEGMISFVLVTSSSTLVLWKVTGNFSAALAAGVVFGAIASATDPASTVEVLWEYRAKGVLTLCIIAVVALDDALAMTLYGVGTSVSQMLTGQDSSIAAEMKKVAYELGGSVAAGAISGGLLNLLLRYVHQKKERLLAISVGMLLVIIGGSNTAGLDVILVTMTMGLVLVNLAPQRSQELFTLLRSFSGPIYVMFFVLVGARLGLSRMPGWLWLVVVLYVLGRNLGKMLGCYIGARRSGASEAVQKYSGLGIFAQGGVAIGLSIMASQHLGHIQITDDLSLGEVIIFGVTATTMIVQLIGPSCVKLSIKLAKEINRNVTEDDIVAMLTVGDVCNKHIEPLRLHDTIACAVEKFAHSEEGTFPVVNAGGDLVGMMTLSHLRDVLVEQDCWNWMLIADVMASVRDTVTESTPLSAAMELMDKLGAEQVLVVDPQAKTRLAGILDARIARQRVEQQLLRQQAAA
ncbi:MAG: cation:proton antiporter [Anaerohalosphaeraceae bacterium]